MKTEITVSKSFEDDSGFTLEFDGFYIDKLTRDDLRFIRREINEALRFARRMEKGEFPSDVRLSQIRKGKFKPFRGAGRTIGADVYIFIDDDEDDARPTVFALELTLGRQAVNIEPLTREDFTGLREEITDILTP
jgi:hypothetical protein